MIVDAPVSNWTYTTITVRYEVKAAATHPGA
jgi:hypothetical protein